MERERRSACRLRLAVPVLVEWRGELWRCVARDLTARGVFVETRRIVPPGSDLWVTFALPDGSWEMTARCVVRHVVRLDAADGALHGMGLSFEAVTTEEESAGVPAGPVPARRLYA